MMTLLNNYTGIWIWFLGLLLLLLVGHVTGDSCRTSSGTYKYCENGCCSNSCCSSGMTTSVLIVACAVSGLVLLALVAAIVICCYKHYKDKQTNRVRNLRQDQDRNALPRVPAQPPKPPTYIEAPPAYSEDLPESHFRPQTVTGQHPIYNQRFSLTQLRQQDRNRQNVNNNNNTSMQSSGSSGIHAQDSSRSVPPYQYQIPITASRHMGRVPVGRDDVSIPGAMEHELPPPYSEFARGQTPASTARSGMQDANHIVRDSLFPEDEITPRPTAHVPQNQHVYSSSNDNAPSSGETIQTRELEPGSTNVSIQDSQSRHSSNQGRHRSGRSRIPTRVQHIRPTEEITGGGSSEPSMPTTHSQSMRFRNNDIENIEIM